jgi:flagellar basal-body rod protein FlgB
MADTNMSIFAMLRTRMQWHQERQKLLSENVANSDTPNYRPHDLAPLKFDPPMRGAAAAVALARTNTAHITSAAALSGSSKFPGNQSGGYEVRPAGNAVNLEDEMLKVASNQMDYQAAATLYSRSLGLVKTALGKR